MMDAARTKTTLSNFEPTPFTKQHVARRNTNIVENDLSVVMDITKSRLLCYLAAVQADEYGFKAAKAYIAMTKVDAPRMCLKIIDEAIQVHGAHGVSQDSRLTDLYTGVRTIRLADGPDIVHLNTIAKEELKKKTSVMGAMVSGTNKNIEKYGKFKNVKVNTTARF
jgi:hypothetical protein